MNAASPAVDPPTAATIPPVSTAVPGADMNTLLGEPAALPWYRRRWLWIAVGAALLAAAGLGWWLMGRAAKAAPSYSTAPVTRGDLTLSVTANGTVQPTRSINIGSELSGTVLKVNVDVNDRIKKGQVLVVLDTAKLRGQIQRSQATLAAAHSRLEQTGATVAEARAALGRLEEVARLSGGKVPSKAELDSGSATLARAIADQGSAKAGISDALAALSTDQINLSKASIAAPADGVVLTRAVEPGNAVAASLQAVTLFVVAEDLARLRLWVYVDEADVGAVKVGQTAVFTVSAYPSRPFPARITRVGFGSTITDNVVTYLTYLDVDNADLSLRPGMTATATIVATQRKDVLLVPNAALRYAPSTAAAVAKKGIASGIAFGPPKTESRRRGAADGASTAAARQVWVLPLDAEGVAISGGAPKAVAVVPGISDGHMTEIVGGELKVGMRVITAQQTASAK
ncbi:efflux RND transporter periplasmic adaptor subunit [Paucibacter sp. TC2R-5]|uniref:efflux RND transporter periplasmic adaptor subunit n=1 Tax=Paucibacter sp. TC2R-5 TaxID=2893555 RepID=UPI0039E109AD